MTAISAAQLQQMIDSFQLMAQQLRANSTNAGSTNAATLASTLEARIGKFLYDPESGSTFEQWYKRYGNFIEQDGKDLDDSAKVRLLVGKLGDTEYSRFADTILPQLPDKLTFKDAVDKLKNLSTIPDPCSFAASNT